MKAAFKFVSEHVEQRLAKRNPMPFAKKILSVESRAFSGSGMSTVMPNGIPLGAISELVGGPSSGRTAVALAHVAEIVRDGSVCAWVDVTDALDPESVAANAVDLDRLLWVRCGTKLGAPAQGLPELLQGFGSGTVTATGQSQHRGGGSPHPRSEGRDMPEAISAMMQAHGGLYDKQARRDKRNIGTPGAPNRPLTVRAEDREEQVNTDRRPPRRGENLCLAPRCSESQPRRVAQLSPKQKLGFAVGRAKHRDEQKPWQALDQALRATDLLLQGGGFSTIVLDLGNVPPEVAWRIPLATWFRFRAACEQTRVSLLLLTQHPCARSSAGLVVRLEPASMVTDSRVMAGLRYRGALERSRLQHEEDGIASLRKSPQPDHAGQWISEASWARAK